MLIRLSSLILIAALSGSAWAGQYTLGVVSIHDPWSRELPPVAPNGAAYFRVDNGGSASAHIVSVHSPIADRVEIHTHDMEGGVMKMRHVESVEVPARGGVAFEPGGLHVMLIGLKQPLVAGERFPLAIEFRDSGRVEVEVEVRSK